MLPDSSDGATHFQLCFHTPARSNFTASLALCTSPSLGGKPPLHPPTRWSQEGPSPLVQHLTSYIPQHRPSLCKHGVLLVSVEDYMYVSFIESIVVYLGRVTFGCCSRYVVWSLLSPFRENRPTAVISYPTTYVIKPLPVYPRCSVAHQIPWTFF